MAIAIYFRSRLGDPGSRAALDEQRAMLAGWLTSQADQPEILQEFIEVEASGLGRPAMAAAIALCKSQKASLVVVSTQPIGAGPPYDPRVASVPLIVLPQLHRPTPEVISLPAKSRNDVSLYVAAMHNGRLPVYLCNPRPVALTEITVSYNGLDTSAGSGGKAIPFGRPQKTFARIEPMTAQLLETRDPMMEGESIEMRGVRFREGGETREGVAYFQGLFDPKFIEVKFKPAHKEPDASSTRAPS